jgi:hypothetical protein
MIFRSKLRVAIAAVTVAGVLSKIKCGRRESSLDAR